MLPQQQKIFALNKSHYSNQERNLSEVVFVNVLSQVLYTFIILAFILVLLTNFIHLCFSKEC